MSRSTLNDYDLRELRTMRGALRKALQNLEWMSEQDRSATDRELRALMVSGTTAYVSQRAKNFQRRWQS